jgi:hypothetical protein
LIVAKKNQILDFNSALFLGTLLDQPSCEKQSCINWKQGHCSLTNPEKVSDFRLDFEDAADFLRLKADGIKGTLS